MEASRDITGPAPSRRLGGDVGQPAQHVTVITTDEPVRVEVGGAPSGRWFKLWNCLVESGAWASFSPAAAKVIVVLAKYANGNPDLACWPGVPTIARDAGLSRSAVFAAISELVSSGWVLRRTVGGGSNATTYQLTEPRGSKRRLRTPSLCSASLPESSSASNSAPDSASHSGLDPILTDPVRPPTPPQRVLAEYVISTADGQPTPVQQAGLDLETKKNKKNSSSARAESSVPQQHRTPPDAAAAALLANEGFGAADVERLSAHGLQRVRDAIDNCDSLAKAGRLRASRRGFIARAIVDGYSLYEGVERSRVPAAASRLATLVGSVATPEELELLNRAYPSPAAIEAIFRRGLLRAADLDSRTPDDLLRKLLGAAR